MGGKFKIKKQQPIASPVGRTPAKVVFGFSELKDEGEYDKEEDDCQTTELYGLLDRRGNIILPPEYKDIYGWNEHSVEVKGNDGYSRTIEL